MITELRYTKFDAFKFRAITDFETLQVIQATRRLYRPENTLRPAYLQIKLNRRRFVKGYMKFKDDPRIIQLGWLG